MGYILGLDLSQFQGDNINFVQVRAAGNLFGFTRMTYAYPGQSMKIDPTANRNYYGMVSAGIKPGGYHKVGWTDPVAEADFFLAAMNPLADGDLLAYDMEPATDVAIPANWSEWEQAFVQRIFDRVAVYPFRYENISMNNDMPKQGIVVNCPSWVAAPSFGWNDILPVSTTVVIQQGPAINISGINANVCDTDAFFAPGTEAEILADLDKYAYHVQQTPVEPPQPIQPPQPTETTTTTTETSTTSSTSSTTSTTTTTLPQVVVGSQPLPKQSFWAWLWDILLKVMYRRHV